jgi:hypothetical protein
MDGESEPGWIVFSPINKHSFCEPFIEDIILNSDNPSVSREVAVHE